MSDATLDSHAAPVSADTLATPPFFDTYALTYAFTFVFLFPGALRLSTLPFRTYSPEYVALVTVPFVLGLLCVFLTDTRDRVGTMLLRSAILIPLVLITGVTVLFTGALTTLPISPYLHPQNYGFTTPIFEALLVVLALPLVYAIGRRVVRPLDWRSAVQLVVLVSALAMAGFVFYLMIVGHGELRSFVRKDITIYITGAVMWYLPSFGIAAGGWRKVGIV